MPSPSSSYPTPKTTFRSHLLHRHTLRQPSTTAQVGPIAERKGPADNPVIKHRNFVPCPRTREGRGQGGPGNPQQDEGFVRRRQHRVKAKHRQVRGDHVRLGQEQEGGRRLLVRGAPRRDGGSVEGRRRGHQAVPGRLQSRPECALQVGHE